MNRISAGVIGLGLVALAPPALAQDGGLRPDQVKFRALYEELVETNTTLSEGSCTLAAERLAARMKAAGFTDDQLTLFAVPEHPKEGGLVAIYPGTSKTAKPMLLLAHLDVVPAPRAGWLYDPFKLTEADGYFHGRGVIDDKAMAAIFLANLIEYLREGFRPERDIILALTADEELARSPPSGWRRG